MLEIGGGEDGDLGWGGATEHIISLVRLYHLRPAHKVFELAARLLREQVGGNADGHLTALMKLLDDLVVFRIILKSAAGIARTRHSQPTSPPHELPALSHQ